MINQSDKKPSAGSLETMLHNVFTAEQDDLLSLCRIANLEPGQDFLGADLRFIDLSDENLEAFDFSGSDLRSADLRRVRIRRNALTGARLEGAKMDGIRWIGRRREILWGSQEGWNDVTAEELTDLVERIDPIDGKYHLGKNTVSVRWRALPFYQNAHLLAVYDRDWPNDALIVYYLTLDQKIFRLNGTSPPIHEVNSKAPIELNEDNVLDYLRFFGFFVRGQEGPFYIAEDIADPRLPDDLDDTSRSVIEGIIRPATFEGMTDKGYFRCDATIFYSNAIFVANFAIQKSGMVEMLDDQPIAADLPARVTVPLA